MTKFGQDRPPEVKPGRGRPKKDDALTGAERARRYREKQQNSGLIKRYVTINNENSPGEDALAEGQRIRELLRDAIATRDYFEGQVRRLHDENDQLLARAHEAERSLTNNLKELIVIRRKLFEMESKS